jgi:hypothetical protein
MVSSKDIQEAKKICADFRQLSKKFFENFYARAEAAGRFPSPLQAGVALGRILDQAAKEYEGPPPDHPGVSAEAFDLIVPRFVQQGYHEAVEAWYRHTPGLEIKKGKPGRKPNVKLAERIWALDAEGKKNREIQETLHTSGENLSLEAVESYLKKRRRARKQ